MSNLKKEENKKGRRRSVKWQTSAHDNDDYAHLFVAIHNIILESTKNFSIEGLASGRTQLIDGHGPLVGFPPRLLTPVSPRWWPFLLPKFATMNPFVSMILSRCSLVNRIMSWMIRFPIGVPSKGPIYGLNNLTTALSIRFGVDRQNIICAFID